MPHHFLDPTIPCGTIRWAVVFPPDNRITCPRCTREKDCHGVVLRVLVYTKRRFPQPVEVWAKPDTKTYAPDNLIRIPKQPKRRNLLYRGQRAPAVAQIAR
jgi:hypothetical protein